MQVGGILGAVFCLDEKKMAINFSMWENMSNFAAQKMCTPSSRKSLKTK